MLTDYKGCKIIIYSSEGNHLANDIIVSHNKRDDLVGIQKSFPQNLRHNDICTVLVVSGLSTFEFQGRVVQDGTDFYFLLFRGKEKAVRQSARYDIDFEAYVEELIREGAKHKLFQPVPVRVVNISRGGVRFVAPPQTLIMGECFTLRLNINEQNKRLVSALVTAYDEQSEDVAEYGCRFLAE